jgi:hypothetical protein
MRATAVLAAFVIAGCGAILGGCAAGPVALQSRFDPGEVAWFAARGTNAIAGSAILRSFNGKVKTCAALPVTLMPVSAYARERMRYLYESENDGFNPLVGGKPADFGGDDPGYRTTAKTTRCDARGRFSFSELPDGDYYLVATVTWRDRAFGMESGGSLMQRVHVSTGETKDVLLAH